MFPKTVAGMAISFTVTLQMTGHINDSILTSAGLTRECVRWSDCPLEQWNEHSKRLGQVKLDEEIIWERVCVFQRIDLA